MIFYLLFCCTTLVFDLFILVRLAPDERDLEIALLRQQLRILERKSKSRTRLTRPEKLALVILELGSRRVHLAGCTANPDHAWVTQQARQLVSHLDNKPQPMRFLIHDRDKKFTASFDQVFASEAIEIVRTPFRASRANAVAERWVRSVRQECLDQMLILNQRHLTRVLKECVHYYNTAQPHQGLAKQVPIPLYRPLHGAIHCRDVLGGILPDYYRDAA